MSEEGESGVVDRLQEDIEGLRDRARDKALDAGTILRRDLLPWQVEAFREVTEWVSELEERINELEESGFGDSGDSEEGAIPPDALQGFAALVLQVCDMVQPTTKEAEVIVAQTQGAAIQILQALGVLPTDLPVPEMPFEEQDSDTEDEKEPEEESQE